MEGGTLAVRRQGTAEFQTHFAIDTKPSQLQPLAGVPILDD